MQDSPILVSYKELAAILVKEKGIREGHWGIFLKFGLNAANVNFELPEGGNKRLLPTVLIPVLEVGVQPFAEPTDLTVNAKEVNPQTRTKKRTKRARSAVKKK